MATKGLFQRQEARDVLAKRAITSVSNRPRTTSTRPSISSSPSNTCSTGSIPARPGRAARTVAGPTPAFR